MSILLQSVEVRHERRIRVLFTHALAAGAFGAPAPAYYTLDNEDGRGPSPAIDAAYLVSGSPTIVELSLRDPLVKGAFYTLHAEGVPATDSTVTAVDTQAGFRWGVGAAKENVEPAGKDRQRLLYGIDLLFNGADYQETATGDLARVDGTANVTKALNRGVESNGLPWDPGWGAGSREFVDSPSVAAGSLKGSVSAQLLRDPRVKKVKVTYEIQDEKTFLFADPVLISGEDIEQVSIAVPNE